MKKQVIKEVIFIIAMTILAGLTLYTIKKNEINTSISFFGGGAYMFLFFMINDYITSYEPEPSQETEIMYFEKTSELQEWTEKLKKEEVEVLFYGTTLNATVKFYDLIDSSKIGTYCIIYKYN